MDYLKKIFEMNFKIVDEMKNFEQKILAIEEEIKRKFPITQEVDFWVMKFKKESDNSEFWAEILIHIQNPPKAQIPQLKNGPEPDSRRQKGETMKKELLKLKEGFLELEKYYLYSEYFDKDPTGSFPKDDLFITYRITLPKD